MVTPLNPLIEIDLQAILLYARAGQLACTCPAAVLYASIDDRTEALYARLTAAPWQPLDPREAN
jgi:hypothetical protein